jgi:hypothetical protein
MRNIFLIIILSINITTNFKAQILADTAVLPSFDSAMAMPVSPITAFFQQAEKITDTEKVTVITKAKKRMSLKQFIVSFYGEVEEATLYAYQGLSDLDGDGKKELVIWYFSSGEECCDEMYIFKPIGTNIYQHSARMYAGHTAILDNKEFEYNLHENFSRFFTCYTCFYSDTADTAPIDVSNIRLKYAKGKLYPILTVSELKSIINDNLEKLGEVPYTALNATESDEGIRKEMAINLTAFYYLFGKNVQATQQLFFKHYKHLDAKKVWTAYLKQLNFVRSNNDF